MTTPAVHRDHHRHTLVIREKRSKSPLRHKDGGQGFGRVSVLVRLPDTVWDHGELQRRPRNNHNNGCIRRLALLRWVDLGLVLVRCRLG